VALDLLARLLQHADEIRQGARVRVALAARIDVHRDVAERVERGDEDREGAALGIDLDARAVRLGAKATAVRVGPRANHFDELFDLDAHVREWIVPDPRSRAVTQLLHASLSMFAIPSATPGVRLGGWS
jgi:hypothetical protein